MLDMGRFIYLFTFLGVWEEEVSDVYGSFSVQ